jgi:hypothetical protein
MFDDPAFFNTWIQDATDEELAALYVDWLNDECIFPINFSLPEECFRRGISLAELEQFTNQQQHEL